MSFKEHLIKLLKTEVKVPLPAGLNKSGTKRSAVQKGCKAKKKLKKLSKKKTAPQTSPNHINNLQPDSDDNLITVYSDSDIEFNVGSTSGSNWVHKLATDVSPSKSELMKELPMYPDVDTVYHVPNKHSPNHIFSILNNISCDDDSDDDDDYLPLGDESTEIEGTKAATCVNCYRINNGRIIQLTNNSCVYLCGSFKLSVIYGNIRLLGYDLQDSSKAANVFSLRGFSYLYLQNVHDGDHYIPYDKIRNNLYKEGLNEFDTTDILSKWKPKHSIIVCKNLDNFMLPYVEKHISQKILPLNDEYFPMLNTNDSNDVNMLYCSTQWDIMNLIDESSKVMICGGKGVGKSTVLRYITNSLLRKYSQVLVIDLDPGQSEFTVPGCVSAVIIKEPIFGPSFTHLQVPEKCVFVENVDVTLDPNLYIKCVKELLKQSENFKGMPTLINYMGYTHSYGINIASTIVTYVLPTILLQINSVQQSKNFEKNLTTDVVIEYSDMFGSSETTTLTYQFIIINSMSDGLSSWQAQGRTTREMCILSYFSQVVDESLSLTSKKVSLYKISLSDITLVCNNLKTIDAKLAAFNASLVVLCTLTDTDNIYNCHGWGIVRGINEEILVLITPVDESTLETITHLAIGSITLPASVLMYEDANVGLVPYVLLGRRTEFNYIPKRSYLPRKGC